MSDPKEIEVKLGVSRPRRIARLIREFDDEGLGEFRATGPSKLVIHTDRYLDTAQVGGALFERGMRARVRRHGRSATLAVKHSGTEAAGITTRTELEGAATHALVPSRWPATNARGVLVAATGDLPLVEIARLRQQRLTRLVRGHGATIELSLDRVDAIVDGRVVDRRHELEAELKAGDPAALGLLVDELRAIPGLGPPAGSKLAFALGARARVAHSGTTSDAGASSDGVAGR